MKPPANVARPRRQPTDIAIDTDRPEDLLTDRELEVLRLTGQAMTTREIAQQTKMSIKTVQRHRDNIREKLELPNAVKLQFFAFRWRQDQAP